MTTPAGVPETSRPSRGAPGTLRRTPFYVGALILAALAFMLMVPLLVTLSAVIPLGADESASAAQRL